jgi:hypothetical protein
MKKLALGAVLAGFLAACGGGGSGDDVVQPIDARADSTTGTDAGDTIDAPVSLACDPIAPPGMQGCATGEKCTWIRVQSTPTIIGALGCVADGAVALGGTCTRGADGQTTGFDNCAAGNICIGPATGGICQDICGFDSSANAACAAGQACTRYQNTFANGTEPQIAGACNPKCNPTTQLRDDNNQACPMGQGCYTLTSATETTAVCARAGTFGHNDRIVYPMGHPQAGMDIPFDFAAANACLPYHMPRRPAPGATNAECGALCVPNDVSQNLNVGDEGGVGNHTCADLNAPPPETTVGGESCRYYWARERFSQTTLSPFSNTLGFCWDHTQLWYDSNDDMTGDMKTPRCTTLAVGSDTLPPTGLIDPLQFWCIKMPTMLTGSFGRSILPQADIPAHADALSAE